MLECSGPSAAGVRREWGVKGVLWPVGLYDGFEDCIWKNSLKVI